MTISFFGVVWEIVMYDAGFHFGWRHSVSEGAKVRAMPSATVLHVFFSCMKRTAPDSPDIPDTAMIRPMTCRFKGCRRIISSLKSSMGPFVGLVPSCPNSTVAFRFILNTKDSWMHYKHIFSSDGLPPVHCSGFDLILLI